MKEIFTSFELAVPNRLALRIQFVKELFSHSNTLNCLICVFGNTFADSVVPNMDFFVLEYNVIDDVLDCF